MSTEAKERSLSLVSDDTMVAIAEENEQLRKTQGELQRRIVALELQIAEARTSVAEKKNADRIKAHDDILYALADPETGLLPQVREALFGKRTAIEEAVNRLANQLQGMADLPSRTEFDVLVSSVRTLKALLETESK